MTKGTAFPKDCVIKRHPRDYWRKWLVFLGMDQPGDSSCITASCPYVPAQKGPMYNKGNKRVGRKAKEEKADVRGTQRSVVVT